ncbi:hypothetical protein [Phormidium sp. CCY1219]|uniref:hypothetical protein n=1 Tax=Phormidium sp. CCY1219 TaxID=2886104 RepID=UPI002D1F5C50|nr:hypothetical protein [Phormidium sp. CCY1219]MEB3830168.1 hypothetical protein [Phormidium sp. CCY1219]
MSQNRDPKRRPDGFQISVRFGVGGLVGTFIAIFFVWDGMTIGGALLTIAILALSCGILSALVGDRFWRMLASWWNWF